MKRKYDHHRQEVEITPLRVDDDPNLKHTIQFGDKIMLFSHYTKGFLSSDLDTRLHHLRDRFGVTTIEQAKPLSRAVFVIEKPAKLYNDMDRLYSDDVVLHYGQSFVLRTLAELGPPFYLRSQPVAPNCSSPVSNFQEVSIDFEQEKDSIWTCQFTDPKFRVEYEGEPVRGNSPILVLHSMTNQFLGSGASKKVLNDFGKEEEVFCKTLLNVHRVEEQQNIWSIVFGKPVRNLQIDVPQTD
jgi:hypothetical protein